MTQEKLKTLFPLIIAGFILVIFASFFIGMFFGKANSKKINKTGTSETQDRFRPGGNMMQRGYGRMQGDRPFIGEVTGIAGNTITLILQNNNGSKTVKVEANTNITDNAVDATISNIKVGDTLIVTGITNTDGSIKAQMIKINPTINAPTNNNSPQ